MNDYRALTEWMAGKKMGENANNAWYGFPEEYDALIESKEQVVLLENTQYDQDNRGSLLFIDPVEVLEIRHINELEGLLTAIANYGEEGYYLAGYFSYECGYQIEKLAMGDYDSGKQPLAWFGVYRQPLIYDHKIGKFKDNRSDEVSRQAYRVSEIAFNLDEVAYAERIARIKEYIRAGDVYQVNFTGRYSFGFEGSALAFYQALKRKQPVRYGAYIRAAGQEMLCFSPELFFRREGQQIVTRPMKGTAPRGRTGKEDQQIAEWLANDSKNRAENVMIVDLLRNDLGRLCEIGSVTVPELFTIERYTTLFQMTSTVEGRLRAGIEWRELFQSLFPCGSITGAPKIRAMQIIKELEESPRGIYTGSIGYFAPAMGQRGQAARATFNVAIRTIVLKDGQGEMGVGSGITSDSLAASEYEECAIKARFLTEPHQVFEILEAILWNDGYQRLEKHMQRMAGSADYFDYHFERGEVEGVLMRLSAPFRKGRQYKVRLKLASSGQCTGEASEIQASRAEAELAVVLSGERIDARDRMYYHKTTVRRLYDQASHFAHENGYADVIFLNEQGEVTEGAIHNIFIERHGELLTPALDSGLLGGTYRQFVLETNSQAREEKLRLDDLLKAEKTYICNAIRGWRRVVIKNRVWYEKGLV